MIMNNTNNGKVNPKITVKGDTSQIQSLELAQEDLEVNQILKENCSPPGEPGQQGEPNNGQVVIPVNVIKNTDNLQVKKGKARNGTESPYKDQKKLHSNSPVELEFKWKGLIIKTIPDIGCCTKVDPEVHKEKVSNTPT
jgi:hypothetical protein